ncbi:WW domain-binding protein 11-like [Asterias rubens]|uniref:WW domain-binding protein 11-like n=1 Tax=Asterias rubens TaxID=7604 RepID=UPI00145541EC|nr:WW domain-binding protein 11-like [Asterias rubens]
MADNNFSTPFLLTIFVVFIFQIGLLNAERNSTENDECEVIGDVSLDGWRTGTRKGVVFVCFDNGGTLEWGVICTSYTWDDFDAKVVCGQLGYGGSSKAVQNAEIEFLSVLSAYKYVAMDSVQCIGNETRLLDCKHGTVCKNPWFISNLAGVKCDDKGDDNDSSGGVSNDSDDGKFDQYDENQFDQYNTWDSGDDRIVTSRTQKKSTVVILVVIGVIIIIISGTVRWMKRCQLQERRNNHVPNTVENFQMVPPNYQVGQHPPPAGSAFPNSQQMYPPNSQTGQMMPQSYPTPYPAGAPQHPPPGGTIPPSQPNPYPPEGPPQYPPAGMIPPSQPNPYPTGGPPQYPPPSQQNPYPTGGSTQQYPYPTAMIPSSQANPYPSGGTPQYPPPINDGTDLPNCPPPSYDDTYTNQNQ